MARRPLVVPAPHVPVVGRGDLKVAAPAEQAGEPAGESQDGKHIQA